MDKKLRPLCLHAKFHPHRCNGAARRPCRAISLKIIHNAIASLDSLLTNHNTSSFYCAARVLASYEKIPHVRLETSGDVLSTAALVEMFNCIVQAVTRSDRKYYCEHRSLALFYECIMNTIGR